MKMCLHNRYFCEHIQTRTT